MRAVARFLVLIASLAGAVAAVVVLPTGCSRSGPTGPTTVRGRVTFQGHPVAGGLIVFAPDPDRGSTGKAARAETGPDGSFQLQLGGSPEIPPGWYRVAIVAPPSTAPAAFPPQLARPDQSGLVREVTPGREHIFEFGVEVPN